jgi:hypothetical protein
MKDGQAARNCSQFIMQVKTPFEARGGTTSIDNEEPIGDPENETRRTQTNSGLQIVSNGNRFESKFGGCLNRKPFLSVRLHLL